MYLGNSGQSWEEKGQPRCPEGGHQPVKGSSISDELILQAFLRKSQQYKRCCLTVALQPNRDVDRMVASPQMQKGNIRFFKEVESTFLHPGISFSPATHAY